MSDSPATVVLVHGLWMHGLVFLPLRRRLAGHGFASAAFSYPSLRESLAGNAAALARFISQLDAGAIHLVGHSLGGLVILRLLADFPAPRLRRVVLMGSPCAGCHSADALLEKPRLAAVVGRSLRDWLAQPAPVLPAGIEIGVIAGSRRFGLGCAIPGLPRPNDGMVAVAETRLPGAAATIVLPLAHSQMLVSRACADEVAAFLRTGHFSHA